jgi:hypothetical protein
VAAVRNFDRVVALTRRPVERAVDPRGEVAGRALRPRVVRKYLLNRSDSRGSKLASSTTLAASPSALASIVTGEPATTACSMPQPSSSALLRVAGWRMALPSCAAAAAGTSACSAKPLPRGGSSEAARGSCVTSSEEMAIRTAASSATTS